MKLEHVMDYRGPRRPAVFVATARKDFPSLRFGIADVTKPSPGRPFDMVYARFLLAHLPTPGQP